MVLKFNFFRKKRFGCLISGGNILFKCYILNMNINILFHHKFNLFLLSFILKKLN